MIEPRDFSRRTRFPGTSGTTFDDIMGMADRAKVELALVRGKRLYDKREALAKRESDREIQRALKERERE